MLSRIKERCQSNSFHQNQDEQISEKIETDRMALNNGDVYNINRYKSSDSEMELNEISSKQRTGNKIKSTLKISNFEIDKPIDLQLSTTNKNLSKFDKNSIEIEMSSSHINTNSTKELKVYMLI